MTVRLPFTPRVQPGESPLSLLRRAALGNGQPSTIRFVFSLNPAIDHSATALGTLARNPRLYRDTCRAMGLEDPEFAEIAYSRTGIGREDDLIWQGLQVGISELQFRREKLCVACYLEHGYAFAEWDHIGAVACARHRVLLDDACPVCSTPWSYVHDPWRCGCSPTAMMARQTPCDPATSSLLSQLLARKDQVGLSRLGRLATLITEWRSWGHSMSRTDFADALSRLHAGRWPSWSPIDQPAGSVGLHPRVALSPLLSDIDPTHRALAHDLLGQTVPPIFVSKLAGVSCSRGMAEAALGIGCVPMRRLIKDQHLEMAGNGMIQLASLNRLLWELKPTDQPLIHGVTWHQLSSGSQRRSLSTLITDVKAGRIAVFGYPMTMGLDALRLEPPKPRHCPASPAVMTIDAAARRLRVNTESIRVLVRLDLIKATRGTAQSAVRWCIDPKSLEDFDLAFCFASAVAKSLGTAPRTLASRLRSAGIQPVSGPGIDGGITFLFQRSDLQSVDLHEIIRAPYRSPAGRKHL